MTDPQSLPVELPPPAVHWEKPLALRDGGEVMAATYYTADQMRAYATACVLAERRRWIGYSASMAGVKRGESLTLDAEMAAMAAMVNAEIRARKP
jgi:hypothetical protein